MRKQLMEAQTVNQEGWHAVCSQGFSQNRIVNDRSPGQRQTNYMTSENPRFPMPFFDRDAAIQGRLLARLPYTVLREAIFADPAVLERLTIFVLGRTRENIVHPVYRNSPSPTGAISSPQFS